MTTIVAYEDENEIIMGCDSQRTIGWSKDRTEENKFVQLPHGYIAIAGSEIVRNIIIGHYHALVDSIDLDLFGANFLFRFLENLYPKLLERKLVNESAEGEIDLKMLYCDKTGIYYIGRQLDFNIQDGFYAIGSGSEFAMGACDALSNLSELNLTVNLTIDNIVSLALRTASLYDIATDSPFHFMSIKKEK